MFINPERSRPVLAEQFAGLRATGQRSRCALQSRRPVIRRVGVQQQRRGFSMIIVMLAIGLSLALTYGFMRTQVTSVQLTQNEIRRDLALEAARTGISGALLRMQDAAWIGLSDTYSKVTQQDGTNLVSCSATYGALTTGQVAGVADADLPLHVVLTSIGTWTSPRDATIKVTRTIKAVVRLTPRLPGRSVRAGDVASATDLSKNSDSYQATLPYTLTATASSSTSLTFEAGTRIEGPVWLNQAMSLFNAAKWSSSIRATMLTEIGNQYGAATSAAMVHPHPLTGPITFSKSPSSSIQTDLGQLKTAWSTTTTSPTAAALNVNDWLTYRLYDKGPVYQAETVSSSLSNSTLQPSTTNPLGIFVCSGNLDVNSNVIVRGTLIVTGTASLLGQGSVVTAYNWLGSSGSPVIDGADGWPRLPALVAKNINLSSGARMIVEGAVLVDSQLAGGGADYTNPSYNQVSFTGTATATPGQQPYSTVQLQGSPKLTSISGGETYAIWLANGTSGRWLPIQSADNSAKTLTVTGEIRITTPVTYSIRLNRANYVSLNGPLLTGTASFSSESMWSIVPANWTDTRADWNTTNAALLLLKQPGISFPDWVANPANLTYAGTSLPSNTATYGLRLEPTTSLQPKTGILYLSNAPLFKPYTSTGTDSAASGYRWKIVDWREDL